ncbi:hypothetical protein [Nonomuraea sp. NPDC049400]|uniref:hypothetical protein n=1 Tax=Nonomuraea sp. NPDC049400 TaxID=3364352 RepID=UPI0037998AA4
MSTFTVAVLRYSVTVAQPLDGKPVDRKEARRLAAMISRLGKEMRDSAPSDIATDFHTVLKAVRTSSSRLTTRHAPIEAIDPMYNKRTRAAKKAVDAYSCA